MSGRLLAAIAAALLSCALRAPAACIEDVTAPDPDDRPLAVRIRSPGASCLSAAGSEAGGSPLLVISYGTSGSSAGHGGSYSQDADSGEDRFGLRVGEKAGQLLVTFPMSPVVWENSETARDRDTTRARE
jgi:hypothetical protein